MGGVFGAQDHGPSVVGEAEGVLAGFTARSGDVAEMGDKTRKESEWSGSTDLFGKYAFQRGEKFFTWLDAPRG
jgi:hypothetical protein